MDIQLDQLRIMGNFSEIILYSLYHKGKNFLNHGKVRPFKKIINTLLTSYDVTESE